MQHKFVTVSAPSRLHFGLISIGDLTERKFGGAGLMIDGPRTNVGIASGDEFQVVAPKSVKEAVLESILVWQKQFAPELFRDRELGDLPIRVAVNNSPRHRGFGSGTQLAFSIAAALQLAFDQPLPSAEEMAMALGRGKRSAIGTYGFLEGGFLVDRGIDNEPVAPLDMRTDFPEDWKIALIQPSVSEESQVFGDAELNAFRQLPGTTQPQADQLTAILRSEILPSVLNQDFSTFADAVTEYGCQSGMHYSPVMGGAYASPEATAIVDKIRGFGQFAVGQSSWGPTIFAIGPSEKEVNWLVEKMADGAEDVVGHVEIVSADNHGMKISFND